VFWILKGKGWGIQTLEDIKACFFSLNLLDVSNTKMVDHNKLHVERHQHTYKIMLNANELTKKNPR
jgi:hypothetical protein